MPSNLARKSARKKKQTRLTFDPIEPELRSSSPAIHMSPASVRYALPDHRATPSSSRNTYRNEDGLESDDPLTSAKKSNMASPFSKGNRIAKVDGKLPFKSLPTPVKSSQMNNRDSLEGDDEYSTVRSSGQGATNARSFRSTTRLSSSKRRTMPTVDLDESDGSAPEEEVESPTKWKKGKQEDESRSPDEDFDQNGEENNELPVLTGRNTRNTARSTSKAKSKIQKSGILSIEDDELGPDATKNSYNGESDEEPVTSPLKRRHRQVVAVESDDSDIRSSPRKRRRPVSTNKDFAAANDDDSKDSDLPSVKDISSTHRDRSSANPPRITRKTKGRKHRTAQQKQMELLRRRRAGEDIEELTDSTDNSSEPKKGVYDTDSSQEVLSNFEDESEPEEIQKPKNKRKQKQKQRTKSDEDTYQLSEDSEFVVEDDEGALGVPDISLLDVPLKFRHAAHKPLKEHFKDAVEWMVHRKINPAFPRNDEVYCQAFLKLDDEYQGYAKSKFVSTQWTAEFTRAIYARPVLVERPCTEGEGIGVDGLPKCDVCNHRKNYPKFAIHFEGKAYSKSTLEEIDSFSDDSESDDGVSVNSRGYSLPPVDKEWYSGIFCRNNAQQAHALIHWKYALNEWVVDQLECEGHLKPEKSAERENMKAKQRRKCSNKIVDEWEENGTIKNLYRDFKSQLEAARESKQGGRWTRVDD